MKILFASSRVVKPATLRAIAIGRPDVPAPQQDHTIQRVRVHAQPFVTVNAHKEPTEVPEAHGVGK